MSIIKKGFAKKNAGLPDICIVIAYFADKTYQLYNRQGDSLMPINRINEDKWKPITTGMEDALCAALNAEEVQVLETTTVRSTAGAVAI